jgi:C4-dicarboxylate-specific signal transduction histidine kinase
MGTVLVIHDLRARKNAEANLHRSAQKLQETTAQLIQAEKLSALGELTAGVAHELNQPLNIIKIISQSLLRDIQKKQLDNNTLEHDDLPQIIAQIARMAEIIDHMRIFTRKTSGQMQELVDINDCIAGALKFLRQQLTNHNIDLQLALGSDLPHILGDGIRLEQVIMNLIINARYAVEKNGQNDKRITITTLAPKDGQVKLILQDNGIGIEAEVIPKIFDPFFTTKEPGEGTGLGLAVSQKIIVEHHGHIKVSSQQGQGTAFTLTFPAHTADA